MRNRFHSLCPYFAMFPESFAESWIDQLSKPGDIVLDPFSGRGTTAFQAQLMGRKPIACDTNDVAFCVTRAKTQAPTLAAVLRRIDEIENGYKSRTWKRPASEAPEFFHYAYHPKTLPQLLYCRETLQWKKSKADCMISALFLGSLHGESEKSPSYLSNQMPRTISTKPAYSVRFWKTKGFVAPERNVFDLIRRMAVFRYETPPPRGDCWVFHTDMRKLPWLENSFPRSIRLVVTSPPYLGVTNFEEDQWLRLWFLGGPTRPTRGKMSRDDRHGTQNAYWTFIADMWRSLGAVLAKNSHVVIRMGARNMDPAEMLRKLKGTAQFARREIHLESHSVSELKRRQTGAFRPGTKGCTIELDCHFKISN